MFAYPIEEYFDAILKWQTGFVIEGYNAKRIDEIIFARYRNKDYKIYWLFFSAEHMIEKPDISKIKNDIITVDYDKDIVISAGISFSLHIACKIYPDPQYILSKLSENVEILIIGGFHADTCVDMLAKAAHEKGIKVEVDEDVTDYFFTYTILCGEIPLIRKTYPTLDELGIVNDFQRKIAIEHCQERPWLSQFT